MANHLGRSAQATTVPPVPAPPRVSAHPVEAIAIVRDEDRRYRILVLTVSDGRVTASREIVRDRTVHLDLAQDAARRAVLGLKP